jgi:hypothetical protein
VIVANQELSTVRSAGRGWCPPCGSATARTACRSCQPLRRRGGVGQEDIERVTGGAIRHLFPSNYRQAVDALNKGCPLVVENHNKLAGSIVGFARNLAGIKPETREEAARPAGIFGRLTGRS